ncbi:polysaccharide export protein EpsE [Chitinivorax sp. PXF-14]|uniref:polysaccharide export protein EpsE n=1 Tax=Chitinivorax sp. PXF-14 TaxID=3230488 RepID=UPI003465596B
MMRRAIKSLLVAASLLGASSLWAAEAEYQLGAGDIVRIGVYGQPDLATEVRVGENGKVVFPLVGEIPVSGISSAVAGQRIADALKRGGFVKQPEVSVLVTQFRSKQVSVLGHVNRPGRYALDTSSTVSDLLAMAGGADPQGADDIVLIQQHDGKTTRREIDLLALLQKGDVSLNLNVGQGDVIYVPRAPLFYVYGEVQRSGAYRIERQMTVSQALSLGGGLTPRGSDSRIVVKRRDAKGAVQTVSIGLDDPVQPDDVLFVKERVF